jgi:two-component system sensor histidine kinase GlrK
MKTAQTARISDRVMRVTAITGGLVAVLGFIISFLNTRTINRSVLLLQKKTRDIAQGKFEEICEISRPPEIKDLADDFNLMCRRLKELDDLKVDFISHVSHELRTPLTAIREASSMLLEGLFRDDPEKRQELLVIVKEECDRLIRSVNRILDLSCMESRMMEYRFGESTLVPVLQKSVLRLAPIARKKRSTWRSNRFPISRPSGPTRNGWSR